MPWVKNSIGNMPSDKQDILNRLAIVNGNLTFDGKIIEVIEGEVSNPPPVVGENVGGVITQSSLQQAFSSTSLASATALNEQDDLMSHCISLDIDDDGYLYGVYYADKTDATERIGNDNTKIYLIKFHPSNPTTIERWLVAEQGSVFTNLSQSLQNAPYDPMLKVLPDKVKIFFLGHEPTGFKVGSVDFNKTTKTIGTVFTILNMTYNGVKYPATAGGLQNLYSTALGKTITSSFVALMTKFIYRGGYYYTTIYGTQVHGVILRTTDFVNFDVFAFMTGADSYAWLYAENAIEFLDDNRIVAISRTNNDVLLKSVYTISTQTWATWEQIATPEAKPLLVKANGEIYAFYNTTADRNTLQIDKVESNGVFTPVYTAVSTASMQYPEYVNVGNVTYFSFSNDRKGMGGSRRSTMSFLPISS